MKHRIYLDYNATTPVRPEVARIMADVNANVFGNPSSAHAEGRRARAIVEDARNTIAAALGAEPLEIVFTGGGTESDNLAIFGVVYQNNRNRRHVVTTVIEHPAVLNACRLLESQDVGVTFVKCDETGMIDVDEIARAVTGDTILISVMHANNEVGTVQPIEKIAAIAREKGIFFHCDAIQSLGKLPVNVRKLGVDLLSISAHKIGGPKGIGALYVRKGTPFSAITYGGRQERARRAGTENVPAIAGFACAVAISVKKQAAEAKRILRLKTLLWKHLKSELPDTILNGDLNHSLPNTLNVSFSRLGGGDIMMALDLDGVAVSTGSACAVGARRPSHVLEAMRLDRNRCCGSVRISLGYLTTEVEVLRTAEIIVATVKRMYKSGKTCCGV
jgi:cysteine desulfurase